MKEKVDKILGGLLERNKDYAIHAYIRNGITDNSIAKLLIPIDRTAKSEEEKYSVKWKVGGIECNDFSLRYDEVMDCYEETREENGLKIAEMATVILKNEMKVEFECCGERI